MSYWPYTKGSMLLRVLVTSVCVTVVLWTPWGPWVTGWQVTYRRKHAALCISDLSLHNVLQWIYWHHAAHVLLAGTLGGEVWMWQVPKWSQMKMFHPHSHLSLCGKILTLHWLMHCTQGQCALSVSQGHKHQHGFMHWWGTHTPLWVQLWPRQYLGYGFNSFLLLGLTSTETITVFSLFGTVGLGTYEYMQS